MIYGRYLRLYADPAQPLTTELDDVDDLDHDLSVRGTKYWKARQITGEKNTHENKAMGKPMLHTSQDVEKKSCTRKQHHGKTKKTQTE